jgi:hypothetical protein
MFIYCSIPDPIEPGTFRIRNFCALALETCFLEFLSKKPLKNTTKSFAWQACVWPDPGNGSGPYPKGRIHIQSILGIGIQSKRDKNNIHIPPQQNGWGVDGGSMLERG